MNPNRLAAHLSIERYGDFTLTHAVRPGPNTPFHPREGYRVEIYRDRLCGVRLPMLSAAISSERVFDVFLALLAPLGDVVHVVLESSHGSRDDEHSDLRRDHIDAPVLASYLCDFEELLTHDGCSGVAVMGSRRTAEVQFDEHKLLHIYAENLKPFRRVLRDFGIRRRKTLAMISEGEHLHHTTVDFADEFQQLAQQIGVGDYDPVTSDEEW